MTELIGVWKKILYLRMLIDAITPIMVFFFNGKSNILLSFPQVSDKIC